MATRPRWSPRKRIRLFGNRTFGAVLNFSRGRPGVGGAVRGFLRSGISLSVNLLGATFNSRGGYSVDGPSVMDFRGRWKTRTPATPRGATRDTKANRPAVVCGRRWEGGAPCKLPSDGHTWHAPADGTPAWSEVADTRRPWWRR